MYSYVYRIRRVSLPTKEYIGRSRHRQKENIKIKILLEVHGRVLSIVI